MAESFPLDWPLGYKKTKYRKPSRFKKDGKFEAIQNLLKSELRKLHATGVIISSNLPLRRDGGLYSEYLSKKVDDPGIAVYFDYWNGSKRQQMVICCDQYFYPWENMYALAKGIEALRSMDRWGVSEFMERAFTGFKAIAEKVETQAWYEVLGIDKTANMDQIKDAYRRMAQVHHPDVGGSATMFNKLTEAYQQGLKIIANQIITKTYGWNK